MCAVPPETLAQAAHLQQCTDKAAHRAFAKRKREEEAAAAAKAARVDAQDVATSRAAFEFLGGRTQDVWRLNEAVREAQSQPSAARSAVRACFARRSLRAMAAT